MSDPTNDPKIVRAFVRIERIDGTSYEIELIDQPDHELRGIVAINTKVVEGEPIEGWMTFAPESRTAHISLDGRICDMKRLG